MGHLLHPRHVLLAVICAVGAACGGESGGDDGAGDDGDGGGGGGGGSEDRGWASWAVDTSGYEHIPNPVVADVSELPVRESETSTGALFDPDIDLVYIRFEADGTTLTFYLRRSRPVATISAAPTATSRSSRPDPVPMRPGHRAATARSSSRPTSRVG